MIRLLISTFFHLGANFVGLLVADLLFDDFSIQWEAYIFAVALFTLVEVIAGPLVTKIALTSVPALRGGIALVTSFIGLLVTDLLFDGVSISGASTWIAATVIVWLGGLLAALILPLIFFRKATGRDEKAPQVPVQGGTWSP
jgi:putative membrane protein